MPTVVSAETLRDALDAAYRYNPRLDAARATLRATDEEVPRAVSGYRPSISATADTGYLRSQTRPALSTDGEAHPHGYAVTATQPIFNGFRTVNQVREAEAGVRAGRETLRTTEIIVLNDAVTAFMDVIRDLNVVELRNNNVDVLSRDLKATKDRLEVGEVTRTDVAQAEARRAAAVSALELARANLKTSRANFERTIGHAPSRLIEPPPLNKALPASLKEAIAIGTRENPNVIAALYREQGARATVDRIYGELLPTVQVDANYQHRYNTAASIDEGEQTTVTGRVSVPIYTSGEVQARVRQAKHTHIARLQEIEQARSETQQTIVAAWSQLEAARAQLVSDQSQVESNRIALEGVRAEERVGQRTLLDVLNAEQELLNAQVQLVTTKRNLVVASYGVLGTLGRLNVKELGATGTIYDPEQHYQEVRRKWWGISITREDGRKEFLDLWPTHGEYHKPVK